MSYADDINDNGPQAPRAEFTNRKPAIDETSKRVACKNCGNSLSLFVLAANKADGWALECRRCGQHHWYTDKEMGLTEDSK